MKRLDYVKATKGDVRKCECGNDKFYVVLKGEKCYIYCTKCKEREEEIGLPIFKRLISKSKPTTRNCQPRDLAI